MGGSIILLAPCCCNHMICRQYISWISTPQQPMRVILLYQKKEFSSRNCSHLTFSYKRICYSDKRVCSSSPWHSSTSIYSSVLQRWSRTERLQPAGRQPCRPVLTASDHAPEPYPHLHAWYPPPGGRHTESHVVQPAVQTERPVWRDGAELWTVTRDEHIPHKRSLEP